MTGIDTPVPSATPEPSTAPSGKGRKDSSRSFGPWLPAPDERRSMLVDVVLALIAAACAVDAFAPAFGGSLWASIGLIGVVAGLLVAYVTVQFRWSPITVVVATVVGFVLLGARAVPDSAVAGVLPGPGTPGALFDGITHGWARLMTTVAPVGVVDNLTAIVYAGGFVAAGGAFHLARRTRTTWLPIVPPIVVMVAGILVGTHAPASTLAQGGVLAVVAIVWASQRGMRTRPPVHVAGAKEWTRRLTAVGFVALIVVAGSAVFQVQGVAGPAQRRVLRDHTQPPFDPNAYPSPLTTYPSWRLMNHEPRTRKTTVMTVKGLPVDVPLRVGVMDTYDGTVWLVDGGSSSGGDPTGSGKFLRVGSDLTAAGDTSAARAMQSSGPTRSIDAHVTLGPGYSDVWVPTLAGVDSLRFSSGDASDLTSALRFNRVTDSAAVSTGVGDGVEVTEQARVPEVGYLGPDGADGVRRAKLVGDADVVSDPGLVAMPQAPSGADGAKDVSSLRSIADDLTRGRTTAYDKAVALEAGLRKKGQGFFSDGLISESSNPLARFPSGHNFAQLGDFVSAVNPDKSGKHLFVGNAERYAAAMALMARSENLPARVVVGFRADADVTKPVRPDGNGDMTFTADQADAWVEIAFQGVGWVSFYPTPPRDQTKLPTQKPETVSPKTADVQAKPPVSPPPNPATLQDQLKKIDDKTHQSSAPFHIPGWVWFLVKLVFYPLIIVAVIVGAITGYKRWRHNRRRTRGTPVDRVTGAWAEMLDQLRDLGAKVPRTGTRREIVAGVSGEPWEQLPGFAAGIDAAMFGPDDPDDESVESLWSWVEAEQKGLLGGLERKRRWLAQLNLASLKPWR